MTERCSFYRLISNSKGSTVFSSINSPANNEYGDYVFWNNMKNNWEVGISEIIFGANNGKVNTKKYTVSIGSFPGHIDQATYAIAIGERAGYYYQPHSSILIGEKAGQYNVTNNYEGNIAIGQQAGQNEQKSYTIAIGTNAGQTNQSATAIAIGQQAGQTGQQPNTIAIGENAGQNNQKPNTVLIGENAGKTNQEQYVVAIGQNAGATYQYSQSIILNATSTTLNSYNTGLFINPIRGPVGTASMLSYNTTTKEIIFNGSSKRFKHDITDIAEDTENIYKLEPREFKYKLNNETDIGLIAEEANDCDNWFAYKDAENIPEGIQWTAINTYLIKEIQNLSKRRDNIKKQLEMLRSQV